MKNVLLLDLGRFLLCTNECVRFGSILQEMEPVSRPAFADESHLEAVRLETTDQSGFEYRRNMISHSCLLCHFIVQQIGFLILIKVSTKVF